MGLTFRTNEKDTPVHGCRDWNQCFRFKEGAKPEELPTFIRAYENNELRGQVGITPEHWIIFLAVDPKYRGHKIGTKLLHKAEKYIRKQGGDLVQLHPQAEFDDALIPWYESEGYAITDIDPACNEFIMQKPIGGKEHEKV